MFSTNCMQRLLLATSLLLLAACQQAAVTSQPAVEQEAVEQPPVAVLPEPESTATVCKVEPPKQCRPASIGDLLLVGRVEYVYLLPQKIKIKARIDTGAGITSLHAEGLRDFDRDGKPWVRFSIRDSSNEMVALELPVKRFVEIKQLTGKPQRRPVVAISVSLGSIEERVEVTLTDRSDYLYRVLIGRNFLRDNAVVDVSKKYSVIRP